MIFSIMLSDTLTLSVAKTFNSTYFDGAQLSMITLHLALWLPAAGCSSLAGPI